MGIDTSKASWKEFLGSFPTITRNKNQILLFQGEAPQFAYVMKKGVAKVYNVSSQGVEQLIGFMKPLDVFPFTWIWGKIPSSLYYYEALNDCEVYCVPRDSYIKYIKSDPDLLASELEKQAKLEVGNALRLNALLNLKAHDKLIHTLHYLAHVHGEPGSSNGTVVINLGLTQQDFANLIGITRETVATELNKLKKSGVIYYSPGVSYQVNLPKINELLNDQFIAEIEQII